MDNNKILVEQSIFAFQRCDDSISKLSESCCVPERSSRMITAHSTITEQINNLKSYKSNKKIIYDCIETVGQLGRDYGFLYATCCTAIREPYYQSLFKELMTVHGNMNSIIGHIH